MIFQANYVTKIELKPIINYKLHNTKANPSIPLTLPALRIPRQNMRSAAVTASINRESLYKKVASTVLVE
ncbi:MAG: hypothetical protein ACJAVV_002861 [Alphaproteobacteria bacterium]|jgi:hypothetical protein